MISSALASSTSGIYQNMQRMQEATQAIAGDPAVSVEAIMNLKQAEHAIQTNVAAANVVYRTTDYLLDILI